MTENDPQPTDRDPLTMLMVAGGQALAEADPALRRRVENGEAELWVREDDGVRVLFADDVELARLRVE